MGIYLTAPALGRILVLAISNSILMPLFDYSWRWTLSIVAAAALTSLVIWLCVSREDPYHESEGGGKNLIGSMRIFPEVIKNRLIRIILLTVLGIFLFNHGTNNWMTEILSDKGLSPSRVGLLAAIPVAMGAVGAVTIPQIATPNRRRFILSLGFLSRA